MAVQRITFNEWTPDQPSIVENLSVAKNVIPATVGYTHRKTPEGTPPSGGIYG